jgi:hypothetical protein
VSDLDSWLDEFRPYISSTKVCGRADLIQEHARLDAALVSLRAEDGDMLASQRVADAKAAVEAVQAQIEASEKEFTFQGIGNEAWWELKKAHPPSEAQRKDGLDVNMETFPAALIAVASADPKVTATQAATMGAKFPPGEYQKLFDAAMEANGQVAGPPKSVMAALIDRHRLNGGSSTTAALEDSLAASSSEDDGDPSTD